MSEGSVRRDVDEVLRVVTATRTRSRRIDASEDRRDIVGVTVVLIAIAVGLGLGGLSVQRHHALQTNAEDLGYVDQVLWNFLRGEAFRFTTYQHAEFALDIDLKGIRRPDSLLAFHVEPILALLAPIYSVVPDVRAILWLQGVALALGAVPAYRLARRRLGSPVAGFTFAALYLISPFGQWAALADFHAVTLAAPLLMLAIDALDAGHRWLFALAAFLAAMTKEDVGLIVAGLGLLGLLRWQTARLGWQRVIGLGLTSRCPRNLRALRRLSLTTIVLGAGWSICCVLLIIPHYSGGTISPFTVRYAALGGSPLAALRVVTERPSAYLDLLNRPEVAEYLSTLLLSGGWLALLAPELLIPATPVLLLNMLSSSPWMAAGRAHYSATVLPLVVATAIIGTERLAGLSERVGSRQATAVTLKVVLSVAVVSGIVGYHRSGIGPFAEGFTPPVMSHHAELGQRLTAGIPPDASVAASSALYPHLSQRAEAYLFPTVREADYVLVDVSDSPYPIEPGGIYERIRELRMGAYEVLTAEDGFVLLKRGATVREQLPDQFFDFARSDDSIEGAPLASFHGGALELLSTRLVTTGEIGPRGPLATLRTVWRARQTVRQRLRPSITVYFSDGTMQVFHNFAALWWYPPEHWRIDEPIRVDVLGLPARQVAGWECEAPLDSSTGDNPETG